MQPSMFHLRKKCMNCGIHDADTILVDEENNLLGCCFVCQRRLGLSIELCAEDLMGPLCQGRDSARNWLLLIIEDVQKAQDAANSDPEWLAIDYDMEGYSDVGGTGPDRED